MADCPGRQALSTNVQCLFTFARVIFVSVQLQLSAESVGEVYIKSTETGQYLAMDTDGLLYGSVSMRPTCFQTWPKFEVSRNRVTLSNANYKATISLCLLFFPAGFPPSTLPYFRFRHERVSCDSLSKYSNYHLDTEETLIEILVTHQSIIAGYLFPLHSFIPKIFLLK